MMPPISDEWQAGNCVRLHLTPYQQLIGYFLTNEISATEFQSVYLRLFKDDQTPFAPDEFAVLHGLFTDVDAFCGDQSLSDPGDLDENQLRDAAAKALSLLQLIR
jgi:hypothetical protein